MKDTFGLTVTVEGGDSKTEVVTPAPTGNTATLTVGDTLVIELPTIPQEGSQWTVTNLDAAILEQVGEPEYTADSAAESAGGVTKITFRAVGPGETELTLDYVKMSGDTSSNTGTNNTFWMQVVVE